MHILSIALGGAIGATLRYTVSGAAYDRFGTDFPYGTLAVNVIGCFLIGFLSYAFSESVVSPNTRALILTGGLGAFTTFSTYGLESVYLWRDGEMQTALMNILANNVMGLLFVVAGLVLARFVFVQMR